MKRPTLGWSEVGKDLLIKFADLLTPTQSRIKNRFKAIELAIISVGFFTMIFTLFAVAFLGGGAR